MAFVCVCVSAYMHTYVGGRRDTLFYRLTVHICVCVCALVHECRVIMIFLLNQFQDHL